MHFYEKVGKIAILQAFSKRREPADAIFDGLFSEKNGCCPGCLKTAAASRQYLPFPFPLSDCLLTAYFFVISYFPTGSSVFIDDFYLNIVELWTSLSYFDDFAGKKHLQKRRNV